VYMTDHEPYHKLLGESPHTKKLDAEIDAFAKNSDLLIREAQYTDEEYVTKRGWGHSTTSDAAISAVNSEAKRLVLFHHDPMHDDQQIDSMVDSCRAKIKEQGKDIRVLGAADKLTLRILRNPSTAERRTSYFGAKTGMDADPVQKLARIYLTPSSLTLTIPASPRNKI